jgi:type IV pilus assembly protein PilA
MKSKGFTLIELLVVVAIIGILAAVGVVAYSGYTAGAKKSTVQANFKMIEKLINSEILKCEMGESLIFEENIACAKSHPSKNSARDGGQMRDGMYAYFLDKIKNPYDLSGIRKNGYWDSEQDLGIITFVGWSSPERLQIGVCIKSPCKDKSNQIEKTITLN